jgi:hypothetical protein
VGAACTAHWHAAIAELDSILSMEMPAIPAGLLASNGLAAARSQPATNAAFCASSAAATRQKPITKAIAKHANRMAVPPSVLGISALACLSCTDQRLQWRTFRWFLYDLGHSAGLANVMSVVQ